MSFVRSFVGYFVSSCFLYLRRSLFVYGMSLFLEFVRALGISSVRHFCRNSVVFLFSQFGISLFLCITFVMS